MQVIKITASFVLAACVAALPQTASDLFTRQAALRDNSTVAVKPDGKIDLPRLVAGASKAPTVLPPKIPQMPTAQSGATDDQVKKLMAAIKKNSAVPANLQKRQEKVTKKLNVPATLRNPEIEQGLSVEAFKKSAYFARKANEAYDKVYMNQYTAVYKNKQATYSNPTCNTFLFQTTNWWYNPDVCAAYCEMIPNCMSYDVFFERDPLTDPSSDCPNPPSVTSSVCRFYSAPISLELATDAEPKIGDFQVVRAGVNGYMKKFPVVSPYLPNFRGEVQKGGLDNRIATGEGHLVGPEFAKYNKFVILHTSVLTEVGFFLAENCLKIFNTIPGAQSFDTFPILVGGDPKSLPTPGAGGRYNGQACIIFSEKGWPDLLYNDVGQFGLDAATGKEAFFSHSPVYHFDKL